MAAMKAKIHSQFSKSISTAFCGLSEPMNFFPPNYKLAIGNRTIPKINVIKQAVTYFAFLFAMHGRFTITPKYYGTIFKSWEGEKM